MCGVVTICFVYICSSKLWNRILPEGQRKKEKEGRKRKEQIYMDKNKNRKKPVFA